ncbi:ankyrin repeat protein [Paecilomyces variotii No. 5]|uniref:Ankyrin repeat protein n=1 Tax=Byssochlamys spectabilis (strain No. 5 / NBRC 109023) TaxID=1356009 RepID=V5G0M1_BYSSN|nr:ankyrin repeat protein [Paecilomyces variotii No. 5]
MRETRTLMSKEIRQNTKHIRESLQDLQLKETFDERDRILPWLSPADVSKNHNAARAKHEPTTGDWLINSSSFSMWINENSKLMWLHGIPGSGKTVLCSTIIDYVRSICKTKTESESVYVYYYFDFNDRQRQTLDCFVRSALAQLSRQVDTIPTEVKKLYDSATKQAEEPTTQRLIDSLYELISRFEKVFIILDALDECHEQDDMIDLMSTLREGDNWVTNLLITSRRERQIEDGILPLTDISVSLDNPGVDSDIQKLVNHVLAADPKLKRRPTALKEEIRKALVEGANGMFRWVSCQLDILKTCLSPSAVHKALQSLPKDLDETYERILCRIDDECRSIAFTALQFLTFSARPVTLAELAEIVAVKPRTSIFVDIDRLFDPSDVLLVCSSLVSCYNKGRWARLAHYSVQEYLVSDRIRRGPAGCFALEEGRSHFDIAERCLTYLLSFDGSQAHKPDCLISGDVQADWELLDYAVHEWFTHVRLISAEHYLVIEPLVYRLLDTTSAAFHHWLTLYRTEDNECGLGTPLHYASELGLSHTVRRLLQTGVDINTIGGMHGSVLAAAAFQGYEDTVLILLDHGADVNCRGGYFDTALQSACVNRREIIFHRLLENGADVNASGGYYGCALQAAAARGWPEAAVKLIDKGADINIVAGQFGTPLQAAARYGHISLIKKLFERGVDVNATAGYYHTALQAAARGGHVDIIHELLNHGADVHIKGGYCGSALEAAYSLDHFDAAEVLKAAGAASAQRNLKSLPDGVRTIHSKTCFLHGYDCYHHVSI